MVTLGFSELLLFLVCAFVAFTFTMAFIKVWWRKWVLFSVAGIASLYLIYSLMWTTADEQYKAEWYIFYFISILAIAACVGMGVIDYVGVAKVAPQQKAVVETTPKAVQPVTTDNHTDKLAKQLETINQQTKELKEAHDEKVKSWFSAQLCDYDKVTQKAITDCAKELVEKGKVNAPTEPIGYNEAYTQLRLEAIAGSLQLIGVEREDCVEFLFTVFASSFTSTARETVSRKMIGVKKIHNIIFGSSEQSK